MDGEVMVVGVLVERSGNGRGGRVNAGIWICDM